VHVGVRQRDGFRNPTKPPEIITETLGLKPAISVRTMLHTLAARTPVLLLHRLLPRSKSRSRQFESFAVMLRVPFGFICDEIRFETRDRPSPSPFQRWAHSQFYRSEMCVGTSDLFRIYSRAHLNIFQQAGRSAEAR
jgi:hypothetical protein